MSLLLLPLLPLLPLPLLLLLMLLVVIMIQNVIKPSATNDHTQGEGLMRDEIEVEGRGGGGFIASMLKLVAA